MPVSDKMADAVDYYLDLEEKAWGGNDEIAQAVVNAAWRGFDKDDESTWPPDDVFKDYYLDVDGHSVVSQFGTHKEGYPKHWRGVSINYNIRIGKTIRYADPQTLIMQQPDVPKQEDSS